MSKRNVEQVILAAINVDPDDVAQGTTRIVTDIPNDRVMVEYTGIAIVPLQEFLAAMQEHADKVPVPLEPVNVDF